MEDKIKRFFECLIPVTSCNLHCEYCYVIQRKNRKMEIPKLKYTSEIIGKGLTIERLGGVCYFSICGAGETLLSEDTVKIAYELLKNGHYVNLTTNGTITKRINEILDFPKEFLSRLHFAFSFHYNELQRLNLIKTFFLNINKIRESECSFVCQINLCDEYLSNWQELKELCIQEIGAAPQVATTRKEQEECGKINKIEYLTNLPEDEYLNKGKEFNSPLFEFTVKNFNVKREEFCYAGDWSGTLNLGTGILSKCYGLKVQDLFEDVSRPIDFTAIGKCNSLFCMNSSHFMSLGVIPDIDTPSYADLRNRKEAGWYTEKMENFLKQKLQDNNHLYSEEKKKKVIASTLRKEKTNNLKYFIKKIMKKAINK